jgi:dienelactone hydrolase
MKGKHFLSSAVKWNMKTYGKTGKIALFMGLFTLLVSILSMYGQTELPGPTGPYTVGRTTFRWVDGSRPEVMTEDPGDFREIMAWVWYPAQANTGEQAGYFPGLPVIADALLESGEMTWWEVMGLRLVRSESRIDALPLQDQVSYPVVILLPGNATNSEFYSVLAGDIASHGYVVVGLNHPYDVPAVELSDGRIVPYDKDQWALSPAAHQTYIRERHLVKVADVSFALDQLQQINSNPNDPLAGFLDLEALAVAGHSLGGLIASDACKAEPRFKACINLDGLQQGGPFSMEESAIPPSQPFLFLTKESRLHRELVQKFEATSESYWVVIHGSEHDSFTDGPLLRSLIWPGVTPAQEHMLLIQKYTLAFLDQTLKGRSAHLLAASVEQEDVSVRVYPSL